MEINEKTLHRKRIGKRIVSMPNSPYSSNVRSKVVCPKQNAVKIYNDKIPLIKQPKNPLYRIFIIDLIERCCTCTL